MLLEKKKINYGIIIIIITIIVKIILLPINYKQYKLNKIINLINKKIEKKNFNSIIEKQKEIIKNYKKFGINPFTSLIIIIFQIVIFSSLFNLFNNLINLRKKKFLWINDLSYYDSIYNFNFSIPLYGNHISLLTLIYIISSFLLNKFNKNNFYNNKKNEFNKYLFSLLFMLSIINNYSSSLSLYYCVYNILNIFTILIFNF
ncbi:membrane protein insertase YidC [Candidatus Shikimatogenerans silvanidophilus]|uniref:membrane protein insertase YidC n=1 Tax=Candidatus Shikimatogenerans silvanidophilus TaxID=2782547 RepID=UPI001BAB2908|nr:membrane protein insertase YidC [Candidatus Shikimatogenerans silvanidophilus]